jgi:hypothetical protein
MGLIGLVTPGIIVHKASRAKLFVLGIERREGGAGEPAIRTGSARGQRGEA